MLECHTEMTAEEVAAVPAETLCDMADEYSEAVHGDAGDIERSIVERYGFCVEW